MRKYFNIWQIISTSFVTFDFWNFYTLVTLDNFRESLLESQVHIYRRHDPADRSGLAPAGPALLLNSYHQLSILQVHSKVKLILVAIVGQKKTLKSTKSKEYISVIEGTTIEE